MPVASKRMRKRSIVRDIWATLDQTAKRQEEFEKSFEKRLEQAAKRQEESEKRLEQAAAKRQAEFEKRLEQDAKRQEESEKRLKQAAAKRQEEFEKRLEQDAKRQEESEKRLKQRQEESEKRLEQAAKRQAESEKRLKQDAAKRQAEFEKRLEQDTKQQEESEKRLKQRQEDFEKRMDRIAKQHEETEKSLGRLGNRLGDVIEHLLVPNLTEKFKDMGYAFTKLSTNVKLNDPQNNLFAEIDAFLENGDCAMVVEVKVKLETDDIKNHIVRMEKIRKYADLRKDKRQFFGTIAATVIPNEIKVYALKQGFYVVEPAGEDVKIITPPGQPKAW